MLVSKSGIIVGATIIADQPFDRLVQNSRHDVAIVVPRHGIPLTKESVIGKALYVSKEFEMQGTALKGSFTQSFKCNMCREGVIVETLGDKIKYLEYIEANSTGRAKKEAAVALANVRKGTSGLHSDVILRLFAVDAAGSLWASSHGIFNDVAVDLSHVSFSDGRTLANILEGYSNVDSVKMSMKNLAIRKVPSFSTNIQVNAHSVRECLGLMGVLLTTRGLGRTFKSPDDVMAEFKLVAEPLLDKLGKEGVAAWEMPWALSSFSRLNLPSDKRMIANQVAGYLTASVGLLSANATGTDVVFRSQTPLGTAISMGKWTFNNNTHSVRIGSSVFTIDGSYNHVVNEALKLNREEVSAIIAVVLDAAQVYGKCMGDNSNWTAVMWADWLGISGLIGGLAINASR